MSKLRIFNFKELYDKNLRFDSSIMDTYIKSSELKEAVRLTSVFSKESNSSIKIEITDSATLKVFSSSQDSGEHISEFEAEIDGSPLIISFNSRYLNDFLNNVKSEDIYFESNGGVTPVVFRSNELENYLHIIMPMKM